VTFDETFDDTIVNERGESVTYFNFSGAERKNIDLACLFAFQDIRRMQGDVKLNISFFDELLDSSFDSAGIELILSVLKDRVDSLQEAVYIITHRTTPPFEYGGKLLTIVKKNGISKLE
jgi:energy-coupling factor transporter ATP-binding protein EcfA2